MTKKIQLTQGKVALVSDEDYECVSQHKWHTVKYKCGFYAKGHPGPMHRFILEPIPFRCVVDHINGDGLDNRRENIRIATRNQNGYNIKGKGKYKGIYLIRKSGRWGAKISHDNLSEHLGAYDTQEEAARAYDKAAKKYHGEFAILNFPEKSPESTI